MSELAAFSHYSRRDVRNKAKNRRQYIHGGRLAEDVRDGYQPRHYFRLIGYSMDQLLH